TVVRLGAQCATASHGVTHVSEHLSPMSPVHTVPRRLGLGTRTHDRRTPKPVGPDRRAGRLGERLQATIRAEAARSEIGPYLPTSLPQTPWVRDSPPPIFDLRCWMSDVRRWMFAPRAPRAVRGAGQPR